MDDENDFTYRSHDPRAADGLALRHQIGDAHESEQHRRPQNGNHRADPLVPFPQLSSD